MTAQAGKDMLLKIEGAPGAFTTVAGLRARTISLNARTVDATDGDSAGRWRELLAGAVLTEQVFTIPGFGKQIVDAVFNRDYAVVQGIVLCTGIAFIAMNILADAAYRVLNPRMSDQ